MKKNNFQNIQEPPKELIQSIINTFSSGQKKEAIIEIETLIKDYPLASLLLNISGTFYKANGQLDFATTRFEQALRLNQNYAEAHYNLGVTLRELGKIKEAIKSYKNAISIKNAYPNAHYNLGNALLSLKQYNDAIKHFELALVFDPKFAQAYHNLGLSYKQLRKDLEAGNNFDKALVIKPDYAEAANNRGIIFQNSGDLGNAIKYFQKSLVMNPNLADAYNNIGLAEKEQNNTVNAIKSFEDALSIDPNFTPAYYNLSQFKDYTLNKEQVKKMHSLVSNNDVSQTDLIFLNFALAGVYENLGNKDEFFNYLHEGNRLRKKELNYSFGTSQELFSIIYKIFAEEPNSIKKSSQSNTQTKRPIFILGMPRSGTSLVEQIISSHESVYGGGELGTLTELSHLIIKNNISNRNYTNISSKKNITFIREKYLDSLAHLNTSVNIITDKTPGNFQNIGFIFSMFPDAKIIHLKRDPTATCWSIYKSNWSRNSYKFSYNIDDLVKFYALYYELMEFWHKKFPEKIYDICYEDLTTNQEQETKKLLKYCELDWDENCLNFHKNKRAVKTASLLQVREKMYQGSSEAWKKYEDQLKPLIDGLKPY